MTSLPTYYQNYLYGDYTRDNSISQDDISRFIDYFAGVLISKPLTSQEKQKIINEFIDNYSAGILQGNNLGNTINQRITDYGLNTPPYNREAWRIIYGSEPQDLSSQDSTPPPAAAAAEEAVSSSSINTNEILAIINVPKTDGYDIFFKGPEVLEYLVTFGDNVDSTSTIKTQENKDIFHNLFTTTNPALYNSEQAFRTDGTKVYQARRSNVDDIRPNNTYVWDSTNLIHMFTSTYPITSLTKIQFSNEIGQVYGGDATNKYSIISPS
jgi:hypothetical protein